MSDKLTKDDLQNLFGDVIPREVAKFIFNADNSGMTCGEMRKWIEEYAKKCNEEEAKNKQWMLDQRTYAHNLLRHLPANTQIWLPDQFPIDTEKLSDILADWLNKTMPSHFSFPGISHG